MDQALQMLTGTPAFLPDGFHANDTRPVARSGARSSLLFVGRRSVGDELETFGGLDLSTRSVAEAARHLRAMANVDILWLASADTIETEIFVDLCEGALDRGCSLVCETALVAIDRLAAAVPGDIRVEWLIDADAIDRQVALAAARRSTGFLKVHEVTRDPAMDRIDRLQEEVARISRLLGDLAGQRAGLVGTPPGHGQAPENYGDFPSEVRAPTRDFATMPRSFVPEERTIERQRAKAVRRILRQRRMREQYFPADLFADPAWDMLLDLYAARLERQPVSVSSLCIAAAVPATTALRWIKAMTDASLFLREADPNDGRRIFIALADAAFESMARYFEALEE